MRSLCYSWATCFDRNDTDKVSSQKTLYYATSNNLCSALPGRTGNTNTHCINALTEFNQLLVDFFNLFDSRLILTLLYDSLNFVISAFSLGLLGGMVQEKQEHCKSESTANFFCVISISLLKGATVLAYVIWVLPVNSVCINWYYLCKWNFCLSFLHFMSSWSLTASVHKPKDSWQFM